MRILCIGCVRFSASVIEKFSQFRAQVVGVISNSASTFLADFVDLGSLPWSWRAPVLSVAPMFVVAHHPAELPRNRGRHPLIWALALGLARIGSTFFFMDQEAASDDILGQKNFPIALSDDAGGIHAEAFMLLNLTVS